MHAKMRAQQRSCITFLFILSPSSSSLEPLYEVSGSCSCSGDLSGSWSSTGENCVLSGLCLSLHSISSHQQSSCICDTHVFLVLCHVPCIALKPLKRAHLEFHVMSSSVGVDGGFEASRSSASFPLLDVTYIAVRVLTLQLQ